MPDSKLKFYLKIAKVFIISVVVSLILLFATDVMIGAHFILIFIAAYIPAATGYLVYHAIQSAEKIMKTGR